MFNTRRASVLTFALLASVPSAAQSTFSLQITKDPTTFMSLTAEGAKVADVATEISRRMNATVIVGASLKDEKTSAKFTGLPFESALRSIAARVVVDYEIRKDTQPLPVGIYLLGDTDPDPPSTAVVKGTSQGLLFTGNTEDGGKPKPDAPLQVTYNKSRLTVISKKQPLIEVILTIADTLGVPGEITLDTTEVVDATIRESLQPDEAIANLSPNVRVYVRVDVNRSARSFLRLLVGPPRRGVTS